MTLKIGVVGYGKIAREEHIPTIRANPDFELVGVVSPGPDHDPGVPWHSDLQGLFRSTQGKLDAIAICTPPAPRYDIARQALSAGIAVLLEKPPTLTLGQLQNLVRIAQSRKIALCSGYHSHFAAGVSLARATLAAEIITRVAIVWSEDAQVWHPGQDWIWKAGNFGVFDTGLNALSLATRVLPLDLFVTAADLTVLEGHQAPITAHITFNTPAMTARIDWRSGQAEQRLIQIETQSGLTVVLWDGGARLSTNGEEQSLAPQQEYLHLYRHFKDVALSKAVDVDFAPMQIVADACLTGSRRMGAAHEISA
jgi:D-galactose 1-dehydrogenase